MECVDPLKKNLLHKSSRHNSFSLISATSQADCGRKVLYSETIDNIRPRFYMNGQSITGSDSSIYKHVTYPGCSGYRYTFLKIFGICYLDGKSSNLIFINDLFAAVV